MIWRCPRRGAVPGIAPGGESLGEVGDDGGHGRFSQHRLARVRAQVFNMRKQRLFSNRLFAGEAQLCLKKGVSLLEGDPFSGLRYVPMVTGSLAPTLLTEALAHVNTT